MRGHHLGFGVTAYEKSKHGGTNSDKVYRPMATKMKNFNIGQAIQELFNTKKLQATK